MAPATPVVVDTDVVSFLFNKHSLATAYKGKYIFDKPDGVPLDW